jgi:hypothetical protein
MSPIARETDSALLRRILALMAHSPHDLHSIIIVAISLPAASGWLFSALYRSASGEVAK